MVDLKKIQEFFKNENFNSSRKMGQNFLFSYDIQNKIVESANIRENDYIIEIGPGLGSITDIIVKKANNLLLIELDKRLCEFLSNKYQDNSKIKLINYDFLKVNLEDVIKIDKNKYHYKVIANLPYSISSLILWKIISSGFIDECIIMVQKEMAQRICAKVNTKNYNAFSAIFQLCTKTHYCFDVGPENFKPRPKVDSSVIKIQTIETWQNTDLNNIYKFFKKCFLFKRKTLLNNLISSFPKHKILDVLNDLNISSNVRSETLAPETLYNLYLKFYDN